MKLVHKTPCKQCPWRKTSAPGWLGGNPPEVYADPVQMNGFMECHQTLGKKPEKRAICVGSLCTSANSCTAIRTVPGVEEMKDLISDEDKAACFKWPGDFYSHHAEGKPYVHPFSRAALKGSEDE